VRYNDDITAIDFSIFDAVVLSPGPGLPKTSGQLISFLKNTLGKLPILGVCLGMQALAEQLGGSLYNQNLVKHGLQERITLVETTLFEGMGRHMEVGLYHSWAVRDDGNYAVTALSKSGVIMGIENKKMQAYGVQFHPESIMTPRGIEVIQNFLKCVKT
jgi:anthranilate synthase component 2